MHFSGMFIWTNKVTFDVSENVALTTKWGVIRRVLCKQKPLSSDTHFQGPHKRWRLGQVRDFYLKPFKNDGLPKF